LAEKSKLPKARLLILTAALALGLGQFSGTAMAKDSKISERDMLDQAVALYEKLSGSEVEIPSLLSDLSDNPSLTKAVVLGFANADELNSPSMDVSLRKQDVMTVLYKTIIDFDDTFALSTDEVDEIMNKCYENARIDEQNRVGYAFMIKHGIITSTTDSEPDKPINWNSCKVLVDVLYDLFMQDLSFDVNGTTVNIGASVSTLTKLIGEPDRIDNSDYDFDWYVYNSDYSRYMMVGVKEGRICAFFSNADGVSFDGISIGDDYIKSFDYLDDDSYRIYNDGNEKIDAVLYNPYNKSKNLTKNSSAIRAVELVDMINSKRASNGLSELRISESLWSQAAEMPSQAKYIELARDNDFEHTMDGASHEVGYDIFSIYAKLVKSDNDCFTENAASIGAGTAVLDDYSVSASVITAADSADDVLSVSDISATQEDAEPTEEPVSEEPTAAPTEEEEPTEEPSEDAEPTEEVSIVSTISSITGSQPIEISLDDELETASPDPTENAVQAIAYTATEVPDDTDDTEVAEEEPEDTPEPTEVPTQQPGSPEIVSPESEATFADGEDVVINLKKSVADEYYVQIYSIEDDEYIVNSYIRTKDTKLTFDASLFTAGKDYTVKVSAVTPDETIDGVEITICYGEAAKDSISVLSPTSGSTTDNDFISLDWESSVYHDYVIDIYNEDGQLLLSQPVEGAEHATVKNLDPGTYHVYINAVRRGTDDVIKAQTSVDVTVELPEPVITEYLLSEGEKFYPVYEDPDMGIVSFYDEEIVDVDTVGANGKTTTVQRKKITEKQIKATSKYRALAAAQQKVEYFEGSDKLQLEKPTTVTNLSGSFLSFGGTAQQQAVCAEAAKYLGIPYVWGGTTTSGFDCSGFVQYVYKQLGIDISRTTYTQVNEGVEVSRDDLQPGDLVFFGASEGTVHHVGIYVGNNTMIHAPRTGTVIQYQSLDTPYYASEYCTARRLIK
jgi:cell wall-associated NlpC family hydrolase